MLFSCVLFLIDAANVLQIVTYTLLKIVKIDGDNLSLGPRIAAVIWE